MQPFILLLFCFILFDTTTQNGQFPVYQQALDSSKVHQKPVLLLFTTKSCKNGNLTNDLIHSSNSVKEFLKEHFLFVELGVDDTTPLTKQEQYFSEFLNKNVTTVGQRNTDLEYVKFNQNVAPFYAIIDSQEQLLGISRYMATSEELLRFLSDAL